MQVTGNVPQAAGFLKFVKLRISQSWGTRIRVQVSK
jgi:hypothetical protein